LGDGQSRSSSTPVSPVGLGDGVTAISAGAFHTCAILTDGSAECWGLNANGQLGNGSTGLEPRPVEVDGIGSVTAISAGAQHTCAISDGAAMCWGRNSRGQIGDGTIDDRLSPTAVAGLSSGVTEITAGTFHSCATTANGVLCWGSDLLGQFGNGSNSSVATPTAGPVKGLESDAHDVDAGYLDNCAITGAGTVQCWGRNTFGQLGNGTSKDSNVPVDVATS
jgi:alpha-tubulin suppressor-like RCC1 family protein